MSLAHVIVDEFTDTPLQGNQLLAVFEDGSALSDDQMQRLAREMNLSETVFLLPAEDGDASQMPHDEWRIRRSAILRWVRGWCADGQP
jgi:PhzF family phenazine biosynthesis protein